MPDTRNPLLATLASAAVRRSANVAALDLVETAAGSGDLDTLAAALESAGLVDTLKGEGPFTVFAPTDEAFAKLPAGTLDRLLQPENRDELVAILTYHVVPGAVNSADVIGVAEVTTVNGATIEITVHRDPAVADDLGHRRFPTAPADAGVVELRLR